MSERGKYHGQRLNTKDVLRLYAAGERDFRGSILFGCNFREVDLSGASFRTSKIISSRFYCCNLQSVDFSKAKFYTSIYSQIGLSLIPLGFYAASIYVLATIFGVLFSFVNFKAGYTLEIAVSIYSLFYIFILLKVAFQGFSLTSLKQVFLMAIFASLSLGLVSVLGIPYTGILLSNSLTTFVSFSAGIFICLSLSTSLFLVSCFFLISFLFSSGDIRGLSRKYSKKAWFAWCLSSPIALLFWLVYGSAPVIIEIAGRNSYIAFSLMITSSAISSFYTSFQTVLGKNNFAFSNKFGVAWSSLRGNHFIGADLFEADFSEATFSDTIFTNSPRQKTNLGLARFYRAEGLDFASWDGTILFASRVRSLLVTLNGIDQDLISVDLQGANLAGAKLHRIDLRGANLNGATLAEAGLYGANLTEAQCIGTDFTGAQLTGACLEAWNIDGTTIFKDIDCEYVFLKAETDARGNRERRPHNPDKVFQPGDFEKLFKEMLDTVQLLIRNGVNPQAFQAAFEQVMADNPEITRDSIQAMEKQGDDILLTLQVPEGTDKAQVERSWDQGYQLGLEAGYTKGLLQGQTQRAEDVKEVALGFSKALSFMQINNQITNMNNPINAGDGGFINTGRMEGNVVNLGELSGQVTVQINQLPDAAPSRDQRSLKELLIELQSAIEAETELSDIEKKEALGEVGKLAEAGTKPQENAMQRVAKRAAANLRSITEPLTEASNLVTVCKSLLPLILAVF